MNYFLNFLTISSRLTDEAVDYDDCGASAFRGLNVADLFTGFPRLFFATRG
jgi:hypothetical protein